MLGTAENLREQCSPGGNEKETEGKWRQSPKRRQYGVIAVKRDKRKR
jgi:hypothetical protein